MTGDHPLVTGAMDLYLGSGKGSVAFAHWPDDGAPDIFLELVFVVASAIGDNPIVNASLSPTPIRVVVDHHLEDRTAAMPASVRLSDGPADLFARLLPAVSRLIPDMLAAGRGFAEDQARSLVAKARQAAQRHLDEGVGRLISLSRVNAAIDQGTIEDAGAERKAVLAALEAATVRLDALRLVAKGNFLG